MNSKGDLNDWNANAARYVSSSGSDGGPIFALFAERFWQSLGDLHGRAVLDLGCGHGWLSQRLHRRGARVCGVDGARALLDVARETCPEVEFRQCDLADPADLPDSFDAVVSHMVVMDVPDLTPLLGWVRGRLRDRGRFLFTLPHPCFFNMKSARDSADGKLFRKLTGYLAPEVWRIETFGGHNHYHRSLTDYFDALRAAGFAVTQLFEPPHWIAPGTPQADAEFRRSIPVFLMIEATPLV